MSFWVGFEVDTRQADTHRSMTHWRLLIEVSAMSGDVWRCSESLTAMRQSWTRS
ncbi:hypothetical protein AXX17_AT2G10230 [Arabidopsis thaliana]|uniref:Uncharacterized protein n=1 Tax=Arabidopsis thaliana TaxID=3702 RepID=A0A178VQI0_ARATH|nr:hypothetical protein AXX17_AT2G10230 [Arabidopsis thaliana]